jgi:hypothetical protein
VPGLPEPVNRISASRRSNSAHSIGMRQLQKRQ